MSDATNGQFTKSGKFAPGNTMARNGKPHAAHVQRIRTKLFKAVTDKDIDEILDELVAQAKLGEPWAIKEILDRCIGKPVQAHLVNAKVEQEKTVKHIVLIREE